MLRGQWSWAGQSGSQQLVPVDPLVPAQWFLMCASWVLGVGGLVPGGGSRDRLGGLEFWEQPGGGVAVRKELLK